MIYLKQVGGEVEAYTFEVDDIETSCTEDVWVENNSTAYILNGSIVLGRSLETTKEFKLFENTQKRDKRLLDGVIYQGVVFDSDTDSKVNIMYAIEDIQDGDTIVWHGKNNDSLAVTKVDLLAIGNLIKQLTSDIWGANGLNITYTNMVNSCTTNEQVQAIEVNYDNI